MASTKRFTYSGDPSKSLKDEVRFLVGDTAKSRALFDDREIVYQTVKTPNPRLAAAELLEAKAAEFSSQADLRVGDVSKAFGKIAENMRMSAAVLRREALKRAVPFFGGLTKSGKVELESRTDDIQPAFSIGMSDGLASQLNTGIHHLIGLGGFLP